MTDKTTAEAFDIFALAVADTADCELNGPDGKPAFNPVTKQRLSITTYGPASEEYAAMQAHQQARMVDYLKQGSERAPLTAEQERRYVAEDLRMITKSFNHFTYPGEFKSEEERFEALYNDRRFGWATNQVNNWHAKWGNYPVVSATK